MSSCSNSTARRCGTCRVSADAAALALGKDLIGLETLTRRADPVHPRHRRAVQGSQRARRSRRCPALRGKTIVNLFFEASTRTRISFEFAEKRLSADTVERRVGGLVRLQGRDAGGHRPQPRGDADRHGGDPPRLLGRGEVPGRPDRVQRDQRRRRQARAPDPGAARHPHPARPVRPHRGTQGRHLRRHPPQPRGAQQHLGADQARRGGRRLRPADAPAAGHRGARRHGPAAHRGCHRVGRRAQRPAAAARTDAGRIHPVAPRVQPRLRRDRASGWRGRRRTWSSSTPGR